MTYLDNAATTMPKPGGVYEAVDQAMRTCASLGRSGHEAARRAAEIAYACRCEAGAMFDADPEQVAFTFNTTHGLNLAIRTLVRPGDRVVVSGFEHNAVMRPLYALDARIVRAGERLFDPHDTLAAFASAVTAGTAAVVCTHVSNVFGYILPLEEIAALCRKRGVPLIIDAAQSAGILPLSLRDTGAAFIAIPGHKGLFGPQGTGLLLCGRTPEPLLYGGTGSLSRSMQMPDFLPDRVEAGTQNIPGIAGLLSGLRFVQQTGLRQIRRHEQLLLERLHQGLSACPGLQDYYGGPEVQTGVLSFRPAGEDCEALASKLSDGGFAVRAGLHCAPTAHASAGTLETGTIRVSLSVLNSAAETDAFGAYLQKIMSPGFF